MIVGITGGIGGGKSTLSDLLREKGFFVYDTDFEAKRLQSEHPEIRQRLIDLFGENIYVDQQLDRKKLADIVFKNSGLLSGLNKIIHPFVRKDFTEWKCKHSNEKYLFVESAIMFESGLYNEMDKIIVVTAPENVRIERVMKRDGVSAEKVLARMKNQLSEEEKIKRADIVLNSEGENVPNKNIEKLLAGLNCSEARE